MLHNIFPCPVYTTKRDANLSFKEDEDIKDIIKKGMHKNYSNSTSQNSYIFNDRLQEIKQFCQQQLKIYIEHVIAPQKGVGFYITQSWLNVNKPGDGHQKHFHPNSIISGVFYISTEEDDKIIFEDPNMKIKNIIEIKPKEYNNWNSPTWYWPVKTNELILFPSWLTHTVPLNKKATTDRISLSFNTFAGGAFGKREDLNELFLKKY